MGSREISLFIIVVNFKSFFCFSRNKVFYLSAVNILKRIAIQEAT